MPESEIADLILPAMRRKQFEARLLAAEIASLLVQALDSQDKPTRRPTAVSKRPAKRATHVHADELFREMGITIK